jgi:hypothetical protein
VWRAIKVALDIATAWDIFAWPWLLPFRDAVIAFVSVGLFGTGSHLSGLGPLQSFLVTLNAYLVVVLILRARQIMRSQRNVVAFEANGLRWLAYPRFFEVFETVELPAYGSIDRYVTGPACPTCLHSMVTWGTDNQTHVVKTLCPGCGATFGKQVRPLYNAMVDAYHAAQARARRGELRQW